MAQPVTCRPLTVEARVQSHVSPCEFCGGRSVTRTGFSLNMSVFSCQYHSTNAPYSSSSKCCSYQKDEWAKSGKLPKYHTRSKIGEHWIQKYFSFFAFRGLRDKGHVTMFETLSPLLNLETWTLLP